MKYRFSFRFIRSEDHAEQEVELMGTNGDDARVGAWALLAERTQDVRPRESWKMVSTMQAAVKAMGLALLLALLPVMGSVAHGETAGAMTLRSFKALPEQSRALLVVGAMATTEEAGLRCPNPQRTASEYVSALTWRRLDESKPWIAYYFSMIDEHGCKVEKSNPVSLDEGA